MISSLRVFRLKLCMHFRFRMVFVFSYSAQYSVYVSHLLFSCYMSHSLSLSLSFVIIFGEEWELWSPTFFNLLCSPVASCRRYKHSIQRPVFKLVRFIFHLEWETKFSTPLKQQEKLYFCILEFYFFGHHTGKQRFLNQNVANILRI
jgi:hypothetical protein